MKETRFAFIVHPLNRSHFTRTIRGIMDRRLKPHSVLSRKWQLSRSSPIHAVTLSFLVDGMKAVCDVMLCPLLPEEMIKDQERAVSKILDSIEIARRQGACLAGLGGYTSIVGNGGLDVASHAAIPVTSGNTYTAASVIQSISDAGKALGLNMMRSCVAIIGATGDIGSACAKSLAESFGKVILVARSDERLESLAQALRLKCGRVSVEKRANKAASNADVIVTVTSSLTTLIEADDVKKNAILCDVSYPANVSRQIRRERPDILVFEGGIVSSKRFISQISSTSPFWEFNPKGGMHACFVETLLLALEKRYTNYSIGRGRISQEKMHEISHLAEKHGFRPMLTWGSPGSADEQVVWRLSTSMARPIPSIENPSEIAGSH